MLFPKNYGRRAKIFRRSTIPIRNTACVALCGHKPSAARVLEARHRCYATDFYSSFHTICPSLTPRTPVPDLDARSEKDRNRCDLYELTSMYSKCMAQAGKMDIFCETTVPHRHFFVPGPNLMTIASRFPPVDSQSGTSAGVQNRTRKN